VRCAACNEDNRDGRKFCGGCGAALPGPCPDCGAQNAAADHYCGNCGRALKAVADPRDRPGDRRPVAVLFCDIVGYTKLSSALDAEEVHALLEQFFGRVDAVVDRYGGVIDKHIGDAAMALFGAPIAHGDDALRAAHAALGIQASASGIQAGGAPLAVHAGVAMGEMVASLTGSDRHRGYTVTGEAANVAARLLDRAAAGETLVSPEIYHATRQAADYEAVGPLHLKGLSAPIEAWRLIGMHRASAGGSALVGRRSELAQCHAALSATASGSSGAVVILRGEPGIGKTRFVEEVQSVAAGLGFSRHFGWVLDFGTERGQGAVRTIVASLIGIAQDASPEEAEAAMAALALRSAEKTDDPLYVRDLLEVPQPEADRLLYEALDTTARARGKERVIGELVADAASREPQLIVVEDIHWSDAGTLALIGAIARATKHSRTALVLTTRIDGDPTGAGWRAMGGESFQLTLDLSPLPPAESRAIATRFAAAEAFTAKCIERAGGNPLFLEQLLRTAGELVDGQLPNSIQSVVLARTDLLEPQDRRAIEAASVLGQRFSLANLRALIDDPRYGGDALLRNALLRTVSDGLQFAHALVRDGVYASLTRGRRRQLHKGAAQIFADDPSLRAEHLDRADDPEASGAYLAASRDQSALYRQDRAAALASRGLSIAGNPGDRIALALQLGDLQLDAGRGPEALEAYRKAREEGASNGEARRALIGCAAANRLVARIDEAFAALAEAEPLAAAADDDRGLAEIHYLRGNLHFARGELEACRSEHSASLQAAQRLDSPEWRARALSGLGDTQYMDCHAKSALSNFAECVAICDTHGLARIAVPNRVMMGHCRLYLCTFDAALADMRTALDAARRIGNRHAEMFALQSIGLCLIAAGRYGEVGRIQYEALELSRALKARRYEAIILAACAELALVDSRPADALSLTRQGLEAAHETGLGFVGPILFGLLALIEPSRDAQDAALVEGEALLAKGAVGHNHFWFRRYAIERALLAKLWDVVDSHVEALLARTSAEPLPYSDLLARRGRALAQIGRGAANDDGRGLAEIRAEAAACGFRLEILGEALRRRG
jgi:class 3 adenylate cyclase/tetratricopeptide (TPR) repeat protein